MTKYISTNTHLLLRPPPASRHVRVLIRVHRLETLLHRARAHPAHQVKRRARLVVRARPSRPAEWLLAHHGARALVVHIHVPRRVQQLAQSLPHRRAVAREHGACERVLALVAQPQHAVPLRVRVHVHGEHGRKDLLRHEAAARVGHAHHGRVHEVALAVVAAAAREDLAALVGARPVDIALGAVEGALADDGGDEDVEVVGLADLDGGNLVGEALAEAGVPERLRDVEARERRALLPGVLEGSADRLAEKPFGVGGNVGQMEIFPTGLFKFVAK